MSYFPVLSHAMGVSLDELKFSEEDLKRFNLVEVFRLELEKVLKKTEPSRSELDPRRKLACSDYFSLMLFALYNPVVKTMRGLCASTRMEKVRRIVSRNEVSLGSFSEAQTIFEPEILRKVLKNVSSKVNGNFGDKRLKKMLEEIVAVDGSLFDALPRMTWAVYRSSGKNNKVKLHLKYNVLGQKVTDAWISEGNKCERKQLRMQWKKGEFYVCDRYYGLDYNYLSSLDQYGCDFVIRIRNDANYEVVQDYPLDELDVKANVLSDQLVILGSPNEEKEPAKLRLVRINVEDKTFLIVTNRKDLSAELIALIYSYRWEIETFFKWIKCILKCRHLLAESPQGVSIQIYCALIAAMLLMGLTGKKPNKRQMEFIQWYLCGVASFDELLNGLNLKKS